MSVLFFDLKGTVLRDMDSYERHVLYAKLYENETNGEKAAILTFLPSIPNYCNDSNLEVINLRSLDIARNYLKIRSYDFIVLGDPFFKPLQFRLLRMLGFINKNSKVQIQFHGDFFNKSWRTTLRNKVKYLLLKFNLSLAYNFRFVSRTQYKNFLSDCNLRIQFVIAPIAIFMSQTQDLPVYSEREKSVGFLGRLEEDRGVLTLIDILKTINFNTRLKLYIAGSGKYEKDLKNVIIEKNLQENVFYLGKKAKSDIEEFWSKIGVLLNLAPQESYGLSMREALVRGVPVITKENSGAFEILEDFPKSPIMFLKNPRFENLFDLIVVACNKKTNKEFNKWQKERDALNLNNLVRSWQ